MNAIRAADVIARYGGDEFMVIATNTSGPQAYELAERLRKTAESHVLEIVDEGKRHFTVRMTISIGVSCYCEKFENVQAFVGSADQMMYRAKKEGRNRTVLWEDCFQTKKDIQPKEISYTV
jgi:diguanylate cyclase (GGDEF)-like protein